MTWRISRRPKKQPSAVDAALEDTEHRLQAVQKEGKETHELSERLREYREANHFTEMLRASFRRI